MDERLKCRRFCQRDPFVNTSSLNGNAEVSYFIADVSKFSSEIFIARRSYASGVLGVVILYACPSVRLSVCLSAVCHTRALWQKANNALRTFWHHPKKQSLVYCHQQWLAGDASFLLKFALKVIHPFEKRRLRQISAYDVSAVRDSERSSIMTNRMSTADFPTSDRWSEYVTIIPPNGGSKSGFLFFLLELNFNRIKSGIQSCIVW